MTIKEELLRGLERLAATLPSKKVTVILCCEANNSEPTTLYNSKNKTSDIMVMTVVTKKNDIQKIFTYAFNEAQASQRRP